MEIPVSQIDTAVPLPEERNRFPWKYMEVGDSVVLPNSARSSAASYANELKRRNGKEFTIRKQDNETCRVWRTK